MGKMYYFMLFLVAMTLVRLVIGDANPVIGTVILFFAFIYFSNKARVVAPVRVTRKPRARKTP